jgi:hypothetical protein
MGFIGRSALLASVVAACLASPLALSPAVAGGCANEAARAQAGAGALPDCRAFELVTPAFKEGVAVGSEPLISEGGTRLIVGALGLFAGAERATGAGGIGSEGGVGADYELARGASGWTTAPVPAPPIAEFPAAGMQTDASPDLASTLWRLGSSSQRAGEGDLYRRAVGGELAHLGPLQPPGEAPRFGNEGSYLGASRDLGQVLVNKSEDQGRWPGDVTSGPDSLYEYAGANRAEPELVGVSNSGVLGSNSEARLISDCGSALGGVQGVQRVDAYNSISAGGEAVFFTALACGAAPVVNELYARIGGASTVAISEPQLSAGRCTGACAGAKHEEGVFQGASADGSKVYFTTSQPLLNSDEQGTGSGLDLYEAELEGGALARLVQVSHDPSPTGAAEVAGVARVSADGSHVYFLAKGVLTTTPNGNGEAAEQGAYNLYVYTAAAAGVPASTAFVARLVSSGEAEELRRGVEQSEAVEAEQAVMTEKAHLVTRTQHQIKTVRGEVAAEESRCEGPSGPERDQCEAALDELEAQLEALSEELPELEEELSEAETELSETISNGLSSAVAARDGVTVADAGRPFAATPDGRSLVFVSARALAGTGDDSTGRQVFEYDQQSGHVWLISVGQYSTSSALSPKIVVSDYREIDRVSEANSSMTVSDDGAHVFFESPDALAPHAAKGEFIKCLTEGSQAACTSPAYAQNVYQYHEGDVSLITTLRDTSGAGLQRLLGTDSSGSDVFFTTVEPLLAQDTDTQIDIYDARVGGGFGGTATQPGCSGDGCEGPPGAAPSLPAPGTAVVGASGNLAAPLPGASPPLVAKAKTKPLTRAQKLARALKACSKKPRHSRAACVRLAKKRYGAKSKTPRRHGSKPGNGRR